MSTRQKVLDFLTEATPEPISGQYIADQLKLSRNAVWKAIEQLRSEGYHIEQQARKGYRLIDAVNHLEIAQLNQKLAPLWPELKIVLEKAVSSTNDLAKIHAAEQPNIPALFIATEQTKGRGRHGRSFVSSLAHGLYLSLVLNPHVDSLNDITLYTTLTAAAMAKAISHFTKTPVQIKWVNDLFYQQKKVAGILCESMIDLESHQVSSIIIGIGLNLAGNFDNESEEIQKVAGTLFGEQLPKTFNYNHLIELFIQYFCQFHQNIHSRSFLNYYEEHLLGLNQKVYYQQNGHNHHAIIRGIDQEGHLLVEHDDQTIEALIGSEIHFSSAQFTEIKGE